MKAEINFKEVERRVKVKFINLNV